MKADLIFPLSDAELAATTQSWTKLDNRYALFPQRLKKLRNAKEVSQQVVADEIGVTKSTISLYETGDNVPDAKTVVKLAKLYGVSTDYLLCQADFNLQSGEFNGLVSRFNRLAKSQSLIEICMDELANLLCIREEVEL